ncbi:hypothetical protein Mia14_0025 [Candidatus Mancarchaeum acidiphilum]|uniref:Uncharacterized protein n=1 Tax=Candidatus Mancarchaeum acidiphilum TaxID=1920749 RepID=A0A218NLN0_9ARCH|nr:hypothetical protein [Candidatus Mancarchaeum acidiphilum]ASI13371.1 hypothetical protein Mia14_0025 [Candidatus Mancarchaeum acidiphilum]
MSESSGEAFISESPTHSIKLEFYSEGTGMVTMVWEPVEDAILQTLFDLTGGVLDQKLIESDGKSARDFADGFIEANGLEDVRESVYEDVKLDKACPKCGSKDLSRSEATLKKSNIPIIPTYICKHCNAKSYYLTDTYLKDLVENHKDLFDENELKELNNDKAKLLENMQEYISRIFAVKKIYRIK